MLRFGLVSLALIGTTACLTSKPNSIYGNSYSATYVSTEGNGARVHRRYRHFAREAHSVERAAGRGE